MGMDETESVGSQQVSEQSTTLYLAFSTLKILPMVDVDWF